MSGYRYENTKNCLVWIGIGAFVIIWTFVADVLEAYGVPHYVALYTPVAAIWIWAGLTLVRRFGRSADR
jgi:hypothetical protein